MPPQRRQLFKSHGSPEPGDFKLQGNEMRRAVRLIESKFRFAVSMILSMLSGVMPLLMNIFMGDMMTGLIGDGADAVAPPPGEMTPEFIALMSDHHLFSHLCRTSRCAWPPLLLR
jgi:hypothetical protein